MSRDDDDNDAITEVVLVSTKSLLVSCVKVEDTAEPKNEKRIVPFQFILSIIIAKCDSIPNYTINNYT